MEVENFELTAEQEREANAAHRFLKATIADGDLHTAFSVMIAFARAIERIDREKNHGLHSKTWKQRADELEERIYKLIMVTVIEPKKEN